MSLDCATLKTKGFNRFKKTSLYKEVFGVSKLYLSAIQNMYETIEKIANRNPKRQNSKPVLFEKRKPLVPVGETFVFDEFAKEDVAPNRAQSEGNRIKD